jgi:hypothetical protein
MQITHKFNVSVDGKPAGSWDAKSSSLAMLAARADLGLDSKAKLTAVEAGPSEAYLDRLPQWARSYIFTLVRDVQRLQDTLDESARPVHPDEPGVSWVGPGYPVINHRVPTDRVRFQSKRGTVEVTKLEDGGVKIWWMEKHGFEAAIRPEISNVVRLDFIRSESI